MVSFLGKNFRVIKMKWTKEEERFLRKHYHNDLTPEEIAEELDRNLSQVYSKASSMGVTREQYGYKKWRKKEEEYLEEYYGKKKVKEMLKN